MQSEKRNNKEKKVLIVDADQKDLTIFSNILTNDFNVETAESGEVGLEKIEKNFPDLVVLSLELPVITGIEILQMIHKKRENLPVVFTSFLKDRKVVMRALKMGASDYLVKPLDPLALRQIIWKRLRERSSRKSHIDNKNINLQILIDLVKMKVIKEGYSLQKANKTFVAELKRLLEEK